MQNKLGKHLDLNAEVVFTDHCVFTMHPAR